MRYVIVALAIFIAGCGSMVPSTGARFTPAERADAKAQGSPAGTTVVRVREFKLPGNHIATSSIIVGPDKALWFTERRGFGRITLDGTISESILRQGASDPGTLSVGPDGNLWANAAEHAPPGRSARPGWIGTQYVIYRVTPSLKRSAFALPSDTDVMPTNLVKVGTRFYFGFQELIQQSNSGRYLPLVATIDMKGQVRTAFHFKSGLTFVAWLNVLRMPGPKLWLYDYQGYIRICTITGSCRRIATYSPEELLDNVHGMTMAYSPVDNDVYIVNCNTWTIYKVSSDGKRLHGYRNPIIQIGYGALAYYDGNIWVTLNGDDKGRPMLGRLTPSNQFTTISLPFSGPTYLVTAMVRGPNGHMWYLRGNYVGEILSRI